MYRRALRAKQFSDVRNDRHGPGSFFLRCRDGFPMLQNLLPAATLLHNEAAGGDLRQHKMLRRAADQVRAIGPPMARRLNGVPAAAPRAARNEPRP